MSMQRRTNINPLTVPPPGTKERRSVCRYSVVLDSAWLGWWKGQAFENTRAKIIDISLRGAKLTVDNFPPREQPVWFCPPGITAQDEWIEVKVIDTRKRLFGPREVRVAFRKAFPYEIFRNVVYGPDAYQPAEQPGWLPVEADERDWW
jgi:hypothetical protein